MANTYRSAAEAADDKARLTALVVALDASPRRLRLDECRQWTIRGRGANYISCDGTRFIAYLSLPERKQAWTWVKKRLHALGWSLRQDGDDEGVFSLNTPSPAQATEVREIMGILKRREMSEEVLARLWAYRRPSAAPPAK